jgi:dihydrofolate reductase
MRKIKLQMQLSLDGFIAAPDGAMDWMVWNWDEVLKKYTTDLTNTADTFMAGRVTGQGMAIYWPTVATNPEASEEDRWMADRLASSPKVIFSRSAITIDWANSRVCNDPAGAVRQLKQTHGKDIILYGGAGIVSSFITQNLIDEYHLFFNPVAIGAGKPIFTALNEKLQLNLVNSTVSSTGIVIMHYERKRKHDL